MAEAQFAGGALGEDWAGLDWACKLGLLSGATFEGEMAELFGGFEAGRGPEQAGGVAKDPALESDGLAGEPEHVHGDSVVVGRASAAPDGLAGLDEQRGEASQFGLPPGFLLAGKFGHLSEVFANPRVPAFEVGEELVADAVSGVDQLAVGAVFTPGLAAFAEPGLDLGAADGEHGAEDHSRVRMNDRENACEAFGPGSAKEFGEDGFGLVVEGVRGGYGIDDTGGHEALEPCVTQAAGGFFDSMPCLPGLLCRVCALDVAAEAKIGGEPLDERGVFVGLGTAQAVVEVNGVENKAEFVGAEREGTDERDRVSAAGEADAETHSGAEKTCIEQLFHSTFHFQVWSHDCGFDCIATQESRAMYTPIRYAGFCDFTRRRAGHAHGRRAAETVFEPEWTSDPDSLAARVCRGSGRHGDLCCGSRGGDRPRRGADCGVCTGAGRVETDGAGQFASDSCGCGGRQPAGVGVECAGAAAVRGGGYCPGA
uniref:Uncharacterized protein n=1 Tax=mine drainage metagenome TaxID=410659 RepID=E6QIW8_9ZZZZ